MSSIDFDILNNIVCLVAKRKSGKSQLMRYIIMKNKHRFDKMFLICPTQAINDFYEEDLFKKNDIFENYSDNWVTALMNKLATINAKKKDDKECKHVLLVLDDVCSDTDFHHSKTLRQLATKGRHYKITLFITCQYLYHVPPIFRSNVDYMCVGQINSQGLEILTSEFIAGDLTKQDFIKMYYKATSNFGFLLINNNSTKSNDDLDSIYGVIKTPKEFIK
jgi:hypothetical protein